MKIKNGILSNVQDSDIPSNGIFVIPESVTKIGFFAFEDCSSLKSITIPDSVTSIESYAFWNCTSLTTVTIPEGVTYIGINAFYNCKSLKSIKIPDSVTYIGINAFWNCTSLTTVTIPNSVTKIGYGAFYNCTSLKSVTIPNSVTSIEYDAFDMCTSLTSVNDLPCKYVDEYPIIITSQKKVSEYMIYHGYYINRINTEEKYYFYVAEKDGFTAHGKTSKEAIEDLNFKIAQDKLAKEPIYLDTVMTIVHYRAITGACSFGVNQWMQEQGIKESDKLTVKQLLPILQKTKAYGFKKFKELIKDN